MLEYQLNVASAKKVDIEVIPSIVLQPVLKRNYFQLIEILKRNQPLTRQLISFYYQTLVVNANFIKNAKCGCSFTIPWMTQHQKNTGNHLILTSEEQYQLYLWVTVNNRKMSPNPSNFEFLIFSLGNYLTQLRTAQRYLNQKLDACCFYNLGLNVKNNQELQNYLRKWIY